MDQVLTKARVEKASLADSLTGPLCALLAFFAAMLSADAATAAVFHSRGEISELAFPDCDRVETRDVFLSPEQRERIERAAGSPLDGDFLTIYKGYSGDRLVGYAMLDSHLVRTLPETLLVVLDASGAVSATYVMAFHEPPDYLPGSGYFTVDGCPTTCALGERSSESPVLR
jgi:transcriptional regulator of nitric oxide reductase